MTPDQIRDAANLLWETWTAQSRLACLPSDLRPATRSDGYAIQERLESRSASALFGWKIAATSKAGQAHIGVDGPLAGRLLRERAFESGAEIPFGRNHMRVAEAEFAFRVGLDLPPRATPYSVDEVLAAVATLHPAIEIPDSRFDDFTAVGAPQLIADNACGHYFVLGAAAPDTWRQLDLAAHRVTAAIDGTPPREGIGANVLGDPRVALTWLVNELSALNIPIRRGQVVTTGTCVAPLDIAPGARVIADFGTLGRVDARLAADA